MSNAIKGIEGMYKAFSEKGDNHAPDGLINLLSSNQDFLAKVKIFDEIASAHPQYEALNEYAFDLMMAHHLESHNHEEDYFDSKEWMDIEDKTIERGTELLNMLLYLSEAKDSDTPVDLEDFLYEFLLVDEDEFQDEHRIYEDLITHQEITEENLDTILNIGKEVSERSEIKELFTPLVLFFKEPDAKTITKEQHHKLAPVERALLAALLAYYA
ncbi:MAG: hypothetical protein ACK5FU_05860 [Bacteroidota bacterium]|jgi:hypothetical protein|nr:hypothetical protein [Sphingobacteriales bacterium]